MAYTGFNTNDDTPPSLAFYNGQLHLFYQQMGGSLIEHAFSSDFGTSWMSYNTMQKQKYFVGTTSAGPCAYVDTLGNLCVYYRDGAKGADGIYHCDSVDGATFQNNKYIGINCDGQPNGIGVPALAKSFLAYNQPGITPTGMLWTPTSPNPWGVINVQDNFPSSITYFQNQLYYFFKYDGQGTTGLMGQTSSDGGYHWTSPKQVGNCTTSSSPFALVDSQNILHVFYRDGAGQGIMNIQSGDGVNWTNSFFIGIGCRIQPTAALLSNGHIGVAGIDPKGKGIMYTAI